MESNSLYTIRPPSPEDINFIMASWLRGLYYGDSWFSQVPKHIFMEHYKKVAIAILMNPAISVRVACLKEDTNSIIGYSIVTADDEAIVWVFVKTIYRNMGVGRSLLPKEPKHVTLLTKLGKTLLSKLPTATFNPWYEPKGNDVGNNQARN